MSTFTSLELRAKRRLGRRGMTITNEFLDEMIAAQELLEKMGTLPKWMKTTSSNQVTLKNLTVLTNLPPTGFIRVYDDQALVYDDEDGNERRAIRLDTLNQLISKRNAFADTDLGNTTAADIWWYMDSDGNTKSIQITPTQTRDVTWRLKYYAAETVLDGGNTNNWCALEPDMIMGMAGIELATWLRDDRALKKFTSQASIGRRTMVNQQESDEFGDTDLVMGGPD